MVEPVFGVDDQWALAPDDHALVMNKRRANRLGFAILLAFFRDRGRFPRDESEVEPQGIAALSRQLNVRFRWTARHFSPDEPPSACAPRFAPGLDSEKLRCRMRKC